MVRDKDQPVIVYDNDSDGTAAQKATGVMKNLGYQQVCEYEAGKVDWKEAGLPMEFGEASA